MDRKTRRMHATRIRARRTKVGALIGVTAAAIAVIFTTGLGQAQNSPGQPKPQVDQVDLTPEPTPVGAGWEGQVGTDANLVAVQWAGDKNAAYTLEVRNGRGEWRPAADTQLFDNGPDPGTQDAVHGATPDSKHVSEPVWVGKGVTGVRVRLDEGAAQDVTLHVIDSTSGNKPDANVESTSTTAVPTTEPAPTTSAPPSSSPPPPSGGSGGAPSSGGGTGGSIGSTPTGPTLPTQQGAGLAQGLAAAALASLVIAFIVRRRRVLAILVVAAIALAACAPTKGDPPGPPQSPTGIPGGLVYRPGWGGDLDWNWNACPNGPEYNQKLNYAIVHHTVNSNNYAPGDVVGMLRGIWAYHVQSLGYCDIAYNFIIDNYGRAFEGRRGGVDKIVVGAHSLGWNTETTGIALLGTFTDVEPSGGAHGTLIDLIRWKFRVHGVNPFEWPDAHIIGHRDTYATECPGQAMYNLLPYTRYYVEAGW
jgi:N-acetylmuramoyl-L-alanine amidase